MYYETMKIRLLLVDDDRSIRKYYRKLLSDTQLNLDISEADNGREALNLFKSKKFDCVLLDYQLTDMTAQHVLSSLQDGPILETPVIIISSHENYELPIELMESGAMDYIKKSCLNVEVMKTTILHTLARAQFLKSQRDYSRSIQDKKESQFVKASIEERSKLEHSNRQLHQLAMHDHLTNLANREFLTIALKQLISQASRQHKRFAVLYLDLDGFKQINDTLGHGIGDMLLIKVSQRITHILREEDILARVGGDEFVVVLRDLLDINHPITVVEKISRELAREFQLDGEKASISTSVGISIFPEAGKTTEELICNADEAMYDAKNSGKNTYRFYDPEAKNQKNTKSTLESQLYKALKANELELYYQPIFNLQTMKLESLEALLRWMNPEQGWVSPDIFIAAAEKSDLIIDIGQWVRKQSCRQIRQWENTAFSDMKICVNASSKEFVRGDMDEELNKLFDRYSISPEKLKIEITERVIVDNIEKNQTTFNKLRELGVDIAIDDFGTGYSSLSYLRNFPVDALKIDASFIKGAPFDRCNTAITETIINMSKNLNIESVAEGIENQQQLDFLVKKGCSFGQGFYLCSPMPAKSLYKKYYRTAADKITFG